MSSLCRGTDKEKIFSKKKQIYNLYLCTLLFMYVAYINNNVYTQGNISKLIHNFQNGIIVNHSGLNTTKRCISIMLHVMEFMLLTDGSET